MIDINRQVEELYEVDEEEELHGTQPFSSYEEPLETILPYFTFMGRRFHDGILHQLEYVENRIPISYLGIRRQISKGTFDNCL